MTGRLLPQFTISTKVGFFPGQAGSVHSLDPARLRRAVQESVDDLGVQPEVVFLHNPERTLVTLPPEHGSDQLAVACAVLAEATRSGLCRSWGIASWNPIPLLSPLRHNQGVMPSPAVLMVRAGLSLNADTLDASEQLLALLGVDSNGKWGMSPFGGDTNDPAWTTTNMAAFLQPEQKWSNWQAAFRLAYDLPQVTRLAVGTSNPAHLHELVEATRLRVRNTTITRYRQLIRAEHL